MPKPIEQRITVDADDAVRGLEEVSGGVKELRQETEESTKTTRESTRVTEDSANTAEDAGKKQGFFARAMDNVRQSAGGMIAGFFGMQTVISYFDALNEAAEKTIQRLDEIAEKANEAAKATLDLHAINLGFNPEDERIVSGFSQATGRSFQDSATALTKFRSSTAALSREDQDRLFNEGLLPYALTTSGSIEPAAKFFGRVSTFTQDPEEINNLLLQSNNLAGESDPAQFLEYAGQLLVAGNGAGLDPAETLALLAFGSSKTETSVATTSLSSIFKKLTQDPATRERLQGLGIDTSGGLFSTFDQFQARGLTGEQSIGLVGIEHSSLLDSIVREYETVQSFRQQNLDALTGGDLANDFITDLVQQSPRHARALQIAQQNQRLAALEREDAERAQTIQIARNQVEFALEEAVQAGTIDASAKEKRLEIFDQKVGSLDFRRHVRGRLNVGGNDGVPGLSERQREGGAILLTDRQRQLLDGRRPVSLPLNEITPEQIVEAAAGVIEESGLFTDLLPGGNQSAFVEISDAVRSELGAGPALPDASGQLSPREREAVREAAMEAAKQVGGDGQGTVHIDQVILKQNLGTEVNGGRNPIDGDFDGSDW